MTASQPDLTSRDRNEESGESGMDLRHVGRSGTVTDAGRGEDLTADLLRFAVAAVTLVVAIALGLVR